MKNIKPKIVALTLLVVFVLVGILSFSYLRSIIDIKDMINQSNNISSVSEQIDSTFYNSKIAVITIAGTLVLSTLLICSFLTRYIICPKNRFIRGDEKTELTDKFNEISSRKNQIETILLHMTDGIVAFNRKGDIILRNPVAKKFLSINPEDETFDDIFGKFNLDINMEKVIYLENWTATEEVIQVEENYVKVFFAPFRDEKDRPDGVIAVVQDITEHVRIDNMQKELVADVSHELKTPITSIMAYSESLMDGGQDEETQKYFLGRIMSESERMARLVSDILTLSRYDRNAVNTKKEQFDLGDLVKECQEKLEWAIKQKNQKVNCFVTADVPLVYANKDEIERAVSNIITNSIKYTPEKGEIKIYVGFVHSDAYIKILDNGIGIPEEELSKIFERFYRVDKARSREMGGTGLGLSITKEILDKNGGSIDIKSVLGEGTEVVIKIPTKEQN